MFLRTTLNIAGVCWLVSEDVQWRYSDGHAQESGSVQTEDLRLSQVPDSLLLSLFLCSSNIHLFLRPSLLCSLFFFFGHSSLLCSLFFVCWLSPELLSNFNNRFSWSFSWRLNHYFLLAFKKCTNSVVNINTRGKFHYFIMYFLFASLSSKKWDPTSSKNSQD